MGKFDWGGLTFSPSGLGFEAGDYRVVYVKDVYAEGEWYASHIRSSPSIHGKGQNPQEALTNLTGAFDPKVNPHFIWRGHVLTWKDDFPLEGSTGPFESGRFTGGWDFPFDVRYVRGEAISVGARDCGVVTGKDPIDALNNMWGIYCRRLQSDIQRKRDEIQNLERILDRDRSRFGVP